MIIESTQLLKHDWESEEKGNTFLAQLDEGSKQTHQSDKPDPAYILASTINRTSSFDTREYAFATQLDVKGPETYEKATSGGHAQQWAHAMEEKLHQLDGNRTWDLHTTWNQVTKL